MKLDNRLLRVLDFIDINDSVCDIGADHGYLSLEMLNKGVKLVQVVENKVGPLNNAKRNLNGYQNVIFSLNDGIENIDSRIDTCVICGMGGYNIIDILNDHIITAKHFKKIILQPNSHVEKLREYLSNNDFNIFDEDIVDLDKHFYHILLINNKKACKLSREEILFGPILLKKQPKELTHKYQIKVDIYKNVLNSQINESEKDRIKKEIELILSNITGVKYES